MKQVLFDTNVILDVALRRELFYAESQKSIALVGNKVIGYINVLTNVHTHYWAKKGKGEQFAKQFIGDLLATFEVANLNKEICEKALLSDFKDFEDSIQNFSATNSGIEIIVTRNSKDYTNSLLTVFEPKQFVEFMENRKS